MPTCCWMALTNCSNSSQLRQTQKFTRYHDGQAPVAPSSGLLEKLEVEVSFLSPSAKSLVVVQKKKGTHVCGGDSGGPLYVTDRGRSVLLGERVGERRGSRSLGAKGRPASQAVPVSAQAPWEGPSPGGTVASEASVLSWISSLPLGAGRSPAGSPEQSEGGDDPSKTTERVCPKTS